MLASAFFRPVTLTAAAWVLLSSCTNSDEPLPTVTLTITGTVTADEDPPLPILGATVELREYKGVASNPGSVVRRRTDQAGQYLLQYTYTSVCEPGSKQLYWVEVSADGYDPQSTHRSLDPYDFEPTIYCTEQTQRIDFVLQRSALASN